MTNEQTALAKVIERIRSKQPTLNDSLNYQNGFRDALSAILDIIKEELPTEREQMGECYEDGKINMRCGEPKTASDYFNQNYTQDGK